MQVVQTVHHLMEVGPWHFFWEFAGVSHEIEEFSSSNELQHDGEAVVGGLISFFVGGIFPDTDQFDQILVIEGFHDLELVFEGV